MGSIRHKTVVAGLLAAASVSLGWDAAAAPPAAPPNDNRADAQTITLPATVNGTTVGATREVGEPASGCAVDGGSVWYRLKSAKQGQIIIALAAHGSLDAVVDVYALQRSQTTEVACERTDAHGQAAPDFFARKNQVFLIRVAQLANSSSDTFQMRVQRKLPAAKPPGAPLPSRGASGTLDRVLNPSVAYSIRMREGVSYRMNLASSKCTPLLLFPPRTRSFQDDSPVRRLRCGGYTLFTPPGGQGGRYSLVAEAPRASGPAKFRLSAGRAAADDTAPGRFIRNYARVGGRLDGSGLNVLDLYRFDVTRHSDLDLSLRSNADFELELLTDTGHRIESSSDSINVRLRPGRYFAVVRASVGDSGSYRLSRVSRFVTATNVAFNGSGQATVGPGRTVSLGVRVGPQASGPVTVVVDRFDPLAGWQFTRQFHLRVHGGSGSVGFIPPSVGRYRAIAFFRGTHAASPSQSGYAKLRVQGPLVSREEVRGTP